jgi:hypothetical protein
VKSNPLAAGGVACHGIREQSDYESAVRNTSSLRVFYSAASRSGDAHRFAEGHVSASGAISATPVCLKSAEPFYEPVVLAPARQNNRSGFERGASSAARTLRCAGAPRPPPARPQ